MKSLIWKEFRENLKWAAVPPLLFVGQMWLMGVCLCDNYFRFVSFVAAVFGGALGILQTASESQGDRRALLLHRPLSPSRIFLAKAITGGGLYLAAMSAPLALFVVDRVIPGRLAPHVPLSMRGLFLLPWLADILTGLVYYFAGMLVGLREGRWYGSRCLGFFAAMLCTLLVWNLANFWQALLAILLFGGLTATAAWGSFLTAGDYEAEPLFAKVALSFTFLAGLTLLSVGGKTLVEDELVDAQRRRTSSYYLLDRHGRVLVLHRQAYACSPIQITDVDGNVPVEFRQHQEPAKIYAELNRLTGPTVALDSIQIRSYRSFEQILVPLANRSTPDAESWGYVPSEGLLVGYDLLGRRLIGSIGPDGFSPVGERPTARFGGDLYFRNNEKSRVSQGPDYLAFPSGVYSVDFAHRDIRKLFAPPAGEVVLGAAVWGEGSKGVEINREDFPGVEFAKSTEFPDESRLAVETDHALYIVSSDGKTVLSLPLVYEPQVYEPVIRQLADPPRIIVRYNPSLRLPVAAREVLPIHLVEYGSSGNELSRRTLPALPVKEPAMKSQPWFGLATPPAEAALLVGPVYDEVYRSTRDRLPERSHLADWLFDFNGAILPQPADLHYGLSNKRVRFYAAGILLNGLLFAVLCGWLARRHAFSWRRGLVWACCGFFFGLAGLLLMFAILDWPARIACTSCGKPRIVTRDACEHCGRPHVPPTADGTEVFEGEIHGEPRSFSSLASIEFGGDG